MTRRQFVAGCALAGAGLAAGCRSGRGNRDFLSEDEAGTLQAICDAVIPGDDYPSASEAGVVTYIDRQLVRAYERHQRAYVLGL
jgi:gluconate 2-dehydrogenase gamma chain